MELPRHDLPTPERERPSRGPLEGLRILEVGGIGPTPFAAMLLADMGADVLRLERSPREAESAPKDPTRRGRTSVVIDLKSDDGREAVLRLAEQADALLEGFRPGVMERLGLGPDVVAERNPRLVYGRMTGYGQEGPLSQVAGHDINYISVAGALGAARRRGERPMFALNFVGDYGGGAMFLAFGVLAALLEAQRSGRGQVVDAAMVDGANLLTSVVHGLAAAGHWDGPPGENILDSGAHFYEVYATADGGHVAVGAIEPQFYARLLELLDIPAAEMPQYDKARWAQFGVRLAEVFASRPTAEWEALLEHDEACATVVRGIFDSHEHPHMAARGSHVELDGLRQPAAAPRLSRTPGAARPAGQDADAALERWGFDSHQRERLRESGALAPAPTLIA